MDEDVRNEKIQKRDRSTFMQILMGCITNISIISPGMSLGFSAIALPIMLSSDNPNQMSEDQASWFASIASIATPFGCLLSGPILDKYGRKNGLYCVNLVIFIGWAVLTFSSNEPEEQYTQLLIGRFLTGLATGLSSIPATVYASEISSPKWRGMLITWTTVAFASGVMFIYTLGAIWKDDWRIPAGISGIVPIFAVILIYCLMPESPQWLLRKNRMEEAKVSMIRLRGYKNKNVPADVKQEIETLINEANKQKILTKENQQLNSVAIYNEKCASPSNNRASKFDKLIRKINYCLRPECYKPFLIMTTYFFFQQFGGTFVVIFYAINIVEMTEVTIDPYISVVFIGITRTVAVVLISYICKKYGRRPPSIVSGSGMCICMVVLAGFLYLVDNDSISSDSFNWIPIVMLILYFFTSTIGFLTIPFAMLGEVYPAEIRGIAGGLTSCCGYIFSFIIVKIFPQMLHALGRHGIFLFFGTMSLIGTIFVIFFLPETKGKTLQEIQDYFKYGDKCQLVVVEEQNKRFIDSVNKSFSVTESEGSKFNVNEKDERIQNV